MALTRSFIRNAAMTPLDARLMNMATLVCNADGSPRVGVLGGANASIVSALATWHFRVQAAEFATSKGKADGVALPTNDGVVDVPIAAGAPASNSRIDVLWVKHEDNTTGDAASLPIFGVTSGAAAASPIEPAIPTGALRLATLRAYAGTTGASGGANVLTNVYQMTAMRGGLIPFRTKVELDAWTTPVVDQRAITLDTRIEYRLVGGVWKAWDSDWITYVATLTNFAVGTLPGGVPRAITKYKYESGRVRVSYDFVFGSNGTAPNQPRFSLLIPSAALKHAFQIVGQGSLYDATGGVYFSVTTLASTVLAQIQHGVSPISDPTFSTPFTWEQGDAMAGELVYDPA